MSLFTKTSLAIAAGASALTVAAPAEAQRWGRYRNNDGAVVAAGVAGLAIGALAASAARDRYYDRGYWGPGYGYGPRAYYGPPRSYYYAPPPRFRGYNRGYSRWDRRADRRAWRRAYRDGYYRGW